jgi:hypothetical protein
MDPLQETVFKKVGIMGPYGSILINPERMRRIDLIDGREDGEVSYKNAVDYLAANRRLFVREIMELHSEVETDLKKSVERTITREELLKATSAVKLAMDIGMSDLYELVYLLTKRISRVKFDPEMNDYIFDFKEIMSVCAQALIRMDLPGADTVVFDQIVNSRRPEFVDYFIDSTRNMGTKRERIVKAIEVLEQVISDKKHYSECVIKKAEEAKRILEARLEFFQ